MMYIVMFISLHLGVVFFLLLHAFLVGIVVHFGLGGLFCVDAVLVMMV